MKRNRVIFFLLLSLLVTLLFLYLKRNKEIPSYINSVGIEFNNERLRCGIPIIENDWVMHDYDSNEVFWSNKDNRVNTSEPIHLNKTIHLQKGSLVFEEDDFHFETDGAIAYRLVCRIKFYDQFDSVSFRFIKYFKKSYPPTVSFEVNKIFADSVLLNWGFEEKYSSANCDRKLVFVQ